jgi:general secretion pathway protein G
MCPIPTFSAKNIRVLLSTVVGLFLSIFLLGIFTTGTGSERVWKAVFQIEQFVEVLEKFRNDTGRYPTTEEGLAALRDRPNVDQGWNGPYLKKLVPLDPWGEPYRYIYPARYGNKNYDLYSFGRNMEDDFGAKDDVTNWREVNLEYYH